MPASTAHMTRRREIDPDTDAEETKFHETVRDILGMSPFDRDWKIYEELRRLKALEAQCSPQ